MWSDNIKKRVNMGWTKTCTNLQRKGGVGDRRTERVKERGMYVHTLQHKQSERSHYCSLLFTVSVLTGRIQDAEGKTPLV